MPFSLPLQISSERSLPDRHLEPVRFGLPIARGLVRPGARFHLRHSRGTTVAQVEAQDLWRDGSVRWLLVDALVPGQITDLELVEGDADGNVASPSVPAPPALTLLVTLSDGARASLNLEAHELVRQGPVVTTRAFSSTMTLGTAPLVVFGEVDLYPGSGIVRVSITLRNPRAATHPGGHFDLGSPNSLQIRDASLSLPSAGASAARLDAGDGSTFQGASVAIVQVSSGGDRWNHHIHIDASRRVPFDHRGYRVRVDDATHVGLRAEPVLHVSGETPVSVAVPRFWQNFPTSLRADRTGVAVGLFPEAAGYLHELQGGEQKTREVVFDVAPADEPGGSRLSWVHAPRLVHASPDYYASTAVIPGLVPRSQSTSPSYERLVASAIEGADSFDAKREAVDEFGWRHFGDIWGDHEAVFYTGEDGPLVSHYNNQYDAVQGFAFQFLRSGDPRWWRHMDELAAHVVDIDVYHTDEDKSSYNHGLFWHTVHYVDADTSTHRAYPRRGSNGGGPSGGHLYPSGLWLHAYLTGARRSRATAQELADYVISCDDGRLTFMKWLSHAPTGVATASGTETYHGPGRAAGNSINALLEALRATGDERYARKLRELLERVFHPSTDIASLNLLDAENKWFYMMYAHSVGKYLDWAVAEDRRDDTYEYARACFLHLTRWMAAHERPYLDKPEELEYPTETWAAQDMRKCDVFLAAARHAASEDERARYLERARFFFEYSVQALEGFETRTLCRPVVLLLSFGWRWFGDQDPAAMPPVTPLAERDWGTPKTFVPQKVQFLRRAKALVAAAAAVTVVAFGALVVWLSR